MTWMRGIRAFQGKKPIVGLREEVHFGGHGLLFEGLRQDQ